MNLKNVIRKTCYILVLVANISCDQFSKHLVRENLQDYQKVSIIPERFILTKVENSGAFLSWGSSLPSTFRFVLLTVFPFAILTVALVFLLMSKRLTQTSRMALAFIVGGGFGNLYDRMVYTTVTDFLHLDLVIFRTGIFNLADVSIMTGAVLLLWSSRKTSASTIQ